MNKKKPIRKIISTSAFLLASMCASNQYIDGCITPVMSSKNDKTFLWKNMNINYKEMGSPSSPPLLLLHNLSPVSSKEEWYLMDGFLEKNFHIFELDLLGCGKSDKPNIIYINYLYAQLVSDFIKLIIKEKTSICAAIYSSSFSLMAARMNPELIYKIILINPPSIKKLLLPVTKQSKLKKNIMELPIIGTFIYNCRMNKTAITNDFKYCYFYQDKNVPDKAIDLAYYNAHIGHSNGKYLLGSILGNYTGINVRYALPKIEKDIYLIADNSCKGIIQDYKNYNEKIHSIYVSNCKLLPHLEIPKTIASKINAIYSIET